MATSYLIDYIWSIFLNTPLPKLPTWYGQDKLCVVTLLCIYVFSIIVKCNPSSMLDNIIYR